MIEVMRSVASALCRLRNGQFSSSISELQNFCTLLLHKEQMVKVIWHERITAADGWFSRIRQVAPMCPPIRAHWRHLANMIELELPSAHRSLQPKREIDRFSCCCIAHGTKSLYLQWAPFPQKIAPSHRGRRTPSNTWFLGPTRVLNPNAI